MDIGRRETAWDRLKGDTHHQLEAYFPFDPYHLPKSKRWVENDYNEWELPRGLRTGDDEDEDTDEIEDQAEDEVDVDVEAEYESDDESIQRESEALAVANVIQV